MKYLIICIESNMIIIVRSSSHFARWSPLRTDFLTIGLGRVGIFHTPEGQNSIPAAQGCGLECQTATGRSGEIKWNTHGFCFFYRCSSWPPYLMEVKTISLYEEPRSEDQFDEYYRISLVKKAWNLHCMIQQTLSFVSCWRNMTSKQKIKSLRTFSQTFVKMGSPDFLS